MRTHISWTWNQKKRYCKTRGNVCTKGMGKWRDKSGVSEMIYRDYGMDMERLLAMLMICVQCCIGIMEDTLYTTVSFLCQQL